MKTTQSIVILVLIILIGIFASCNQNKPGENDMQGSQNEATMSGNSRMGADNRISLKLNAMQKKHQLMNMRDHLEAVQNIITLLAADKYDEASKIAYTKLGSTTEMKLMCASFGDKKFETLGLEFHNSADKMSETFKNGNKEESLNALSNTMNFCVQCHATYRQ